MKKGFYLLIFVMAVTLMVSCGRNEVKQSLQQMEKIVEKAEKEKDKLSQEEWKMLAEQFEEYKKIVKNALENKKIGATVQSRCTALTTRWAALCGPIMLEVLFPDLREPLQNLSGDLKKMAEGLKDEAIMKRASVLGKDSLRGEID